MSSNDFKQRGGELLPREQMERAADPAHVPDEALVAILLKTGARGLNVFDLRKNERWLSLDRGVRDSIKIDAIRFLENCNGPWSTDQSYYPAYGLTFCFLHVASPMALAKLDKEVWRKFAPELFRIAGFDYFKAFAPVMERFAKLQPDIFTDALLDHIRMCLGQNRNLSLGDACMAMASDAGICREVFARCERGAVPRGDVFTVLDAFWKSNPDEVLAHINRTKRYSRLRADEDIRMTSFIFAAAPASFSRWLKKMERDPERAREWSRCVIGRRDWPNVSAWAFADHLGLEENAVCISCWQGCMRRHRVLCWMVRLMRPIVSTHL